MSIHTQPEPPDPLYQCADRLNDLAVVTEAVVVPGAVEVLLREGRDAVPRIVADVVYGCGLEIGGVSRRSSGPVGHRLVVIARG